MTASFKQLLVHLDASVAAANRLTLARRLAQQHGAVLSALYAATPTFTGMAFPPGLAPSTAGSLIEIDRDRRARTRKMFDECLVTPGPAVEWSETVAAPVIGAFAEQALYADLVIAGQRSDSDEMAVPPDFPEAVMLASGRPVLVVPYVGAPRRVGDNVAIAWKDTREATRAVTAAMPILQRARQVHILSWSDGTDEGGTVVKGSRLDLDSYLQRHGVQATWHRGGLEQRDLGPILLSRLFDLGADLLVMGCYGHSRARQWMLGGTSRTVLASMTVPVLMAH